MIEVPLIDAQVADAGRHRRIAAADDVAGVEGTGRESRVVIAEHNVGVGKARGSGNVVVAFDQAGIEGAARRDVVVIADRDGGVGQPQRDGVVVAAESLAIVERAGDEHVVVRAGDADVVGEAEDRHGARRATIFETLDARTEEMLLHLT